MIGMQIIVNSFLIAFFLVVLFILYVNGKTFYVKWKQKRIKKRDKQIRNYLRNFKDDDKLAIIDETPREVFVGDRFYLLKPLKYRQYTRLCILFSKMLQKLHENGIEFTSPESAIGDSMEILEDDYFKAIALVLYYSNHEQEQTDKQVFDGMHKEYEYLRKNATLEQISRVLEVIQMQNDINRALQAFGLLGKKKQAQPKK